MKRSVKNEDLLPRKNNQIILNRYGSVEKGINSHVRLWLEIHYAKYIMNFIGTLHIRKSIPLKIELYCYSLIYAGIKPVYQSLVTINDGVIYNLINSSKQAFE